MAGRESFKQINTFEGAHYKKSYTTNEIEGEAIVELHGVNYLEEEYADRGEEILKVENGISITQYANPCKILFDEDILSKHILIIGGIGMGKTNTFKSIVEQVSKKTGENDVSLIFDTKGDFYNRFGDAQSDKDILIANGELCDKNGTKKSPSKAEIWNIFSELDDEKLVETSSEIASMMFASHVEKTSQTFFPLAAKSIFAAVLRSIYRLPKDMLVAEPSNLLLKNFFNGDNILKPDEGFEDLWEKTPGTLKNIKNLLNGDEYERGVLSYISNSDDDDSIDGQTLGVIAELRLVIDELFVGNFAKEGEFSIIKAMKNKGGARIFLEYDIVQGAVLAPIYSLLVDLAIKETLHQRNDEAKSNYYFIIDEFKLLPNLKHMDDAVNFGRSLGVKFIIGVQNVSQIIETYGQDRAMNILSGFSTTIAYRVSDYATRSYLIQLFGVNRKRTTFLSIINSRGVVEQLERANVVEDWDILSLGVGECIVRLPNGKRCDNSSPVFVKMLPYPFRFK